MEMPPVGLDGLLNPAARHYKAGQLDAAEGLYRQALGLAPGHPRALHGLGLLAWRRGDLAAALDFMELARPATDILHVLRNDMGLVHLSAGRLEEALACFLEAATLRPDFPDAHGNLSIVYERLGRLSEAAAALERAIALRPDLADLYFTFGNVLVKLGRREEAAGQLQRAVELQPDHAPAHHNLGMALLDLGRAAEAIASLRRALALLPDSEMVKASLGAAYLEQGDLGRGLRWTRRGHGLIRFDAQDGVKLFPRDMPGARIDETD